VLFFPFVFLWHVSYLFGFLVVKIIRSWFIQKFCSNRSPLIRNLGILGIEVDILNIGSFFLQKFWIIKQNIPYWKALFNIGYICHCFLWSFSNVQIAFKCFYHKMRCFYCRRIKSYTFWWSCLCDSWNLSIIYNMLYFSASVASILFTSSFKKMPRLLQWWSNKSTILQIRSLYF